MDKDLIEFLAGLGVLITLFILIALLIKYLQRRLSRWSELSVVFPAPAYTQEIRFYKNIPGQAGRFSFSSRNSGGISVGFTSEGMLIRLRSRKYQDLLVPWYKIRSADKYTLGSQSAVKVTVDSRIPLHFYISDEALNAFETWHKVTDEPLERLLDDHSHY